MLERLSGNKVECTRIFNVCEYQVLLRSSFKEFVHLFQSPRQYFELKTITKNTLETGCLAGKSFPVAKIIFSRFEKTK